MRPQMALPANREGIMMRCHDFDILRRSAAPATRRITVSRSTVSDVCSICNADAAGTK